MTKYIINTSKKYDKPNYLDIESHKTVNPDEPRSGDETNNHFIE